MSAPRERTAVSAALIGLCLLACPLVAAPLDPLVAQAEERRVRVIERLSRSTVAIFERSAGNGGSGVIVSPDGLVVTNYHVTAPCGPTMLCGLSDGRLVEAVLLGVDPTGDIALVQLLGDGPYPSAEWGDSDRVQVGEPAIVAGNPFLLAQDFTPSISVGVISGTHRYQYPSGTLLEYADCLQTDAAINPGNSGGPLFDGHGRLIGINGRGSFEKRGRVNVGVGYAVSINQVRRFVSHLAAGHLVDHAALGATVVTRSGPQAIVDAIETSSDAYRRGLRAGDELVSFDGRDTPTANALLNAVGVLPAGWRSRIEFRRDGRLYRRDVRLGALHSPGELEAAVADGAKPNEKPAAPAREVYQRREGYANYAAVRRTTRRLLAYCREDTGGTAGEVDALYRDEVRDEPVRLRITKDGAEWLAPSGEFRLDARRPMASQAAPPAAPALLGALWVWRQLADGEQGRLDLVEGRGRLPWEALGEPHDVLSVTHHGLSVEFYFDPQSHALRGVEASRDASEDAVRIEMESPEASSLRVFVGDRLFADLRAGEPTVDRGTEP